MDTRYTNSQQTWKYIKMTRKRKSNNETFFTCYKLKLDQKDKWELRTKSKVAAKQQYFTGHIYILVADSTYVMLLRASQVWWLLWYFMRMNSRILLINKVWSFKSALIPSLWAFSLFLLVFSCRISFYFWSISKNNHESLVYMSHFSYFHEKKNLVENWLF